MENKMENKMKKCKLFLALGEEQELQDGSAAAADPIWGEGGELFVRRRRRGRA